MPETEEKKTEGGGDAWDATQWHEVKKGETLWKIAEQYYGDGALYPKIFEAGSAQRLIDANVKWRRQCFAVKAHLGARPARRAALRR